MVNGKSNEADAHEGNNGCSDGRQSKGSINDEGDSMCHDSRVQDRVRKWLPTIVDGRWRGR